MEISKRASNYIKAGLGASLGAGLIFLLDPQEGKKRRQVIRDRLIKTFSQTKQQLGDILSEAKQQASKKRGKSQSTQSTS